MTPQLATWEALTDRVGKLERQNRRMNQMGAVVLILAAAVLLMGQASPQRTVEANEFILRDGNGKVRARLSSQLGVAGIAFYDENGSERAELSVNSSSQRLTFYDPPDRKIKAELNASFPSLTLFDEDQKLLWKAP